jgi:hypothetical protein
MTTKHRAKNSQRMRATVRELEALPLPKGSISKALVEPIERPEDYPVLDEEALYGPIGDAIKLVAPYTEADPAAVLGTVLAYVSALIGPETWTRVSNITLRASLFALIVGPTAEGRKGTSHHQALELIGDIDDVRCVGGLTSGEGMVELLAGKEAERQHTIVTEEEFARFLDSAGRNGSTISSTVRQLFDGSRLGHTTVAGSKVVEDYHVAFLGHITPDELRKCLSDSDKSNGLANRFMMVASHTERVITFGATDAAAQSAIRAGRAAHLGDLARQGQGRGLVPLSDEALAAYHHIRVEETKHPSGSLLARMPQQLLRIALVYAVMDAAAEVTLAHLLAAYRFLIYVAATTEFIYGDGATRLEAKVLGAVRSAGSAGLRLTDLRRALSNHGTSKEMHATIDSLADQQLVRVEKDESGPGRPVTRVYAIDEEAECQ